MTHFTLTVATSLDGLISRSINEPPQSWASKEEQELFFRDVEAADWAIMGRNTHEAADKPYRRRIFFSSRTNVWQRPTQIWLDPVDLTLDDLVACVADTYPLVNGLILGGTRVHDWFLAHDAIQNVHLTIEPVTFGTGLPIFSNQPSTDPCKAFTSNGFTIESDNLINSEGTRILKMTKT